jgi:polar amino acid transport system substrate-binding protein
MNKDSKPISIATIALCAIVSVAVSFSLANPNTGHLKTTNTLNVYERVINSGILHCGYFEEAPFTMIDPNTGKKSGIAVELAEKIASELGLKLEWVGATNFGTLTEDLRSGRYDAICASLFTLPRAGRIDYTIPYTYVPVYGYTQDGRTDFDNKLEHQDWATVTVAGLDGEGSTTVARMKVPEAKFAILPQSAQIADMLTSVADKKADIGFVMPTVFKNFDTNNPHRLHKIIADKPFYVFSVGFGVKPDEPAFKNMLDFVMRDLAADGTLQSLFDKYDLNHLLFRPQSVYKTAE